MAIKLYQRQNQQIQGIGVIQPQQSTTGTQIASGLNSYAGKLQRLANDNFSLGKAQVLNDITTQAYQISPDNIDRFNELVQDGLNKSLQEIDEENQKKIRESIDLKLESVRHKIVQNKLTRLDKENKERVISNGNSILNGAGGIFETNNAIADYLYQTSNSTGEARTRNAEFGKKHIANNKNNYKQLLALTTLKDTNGNPYLSQRDYESFVKQSKDNLIETLKQKIYSLNGEDLKTFYENTLQDNKAMDSIGLSFDNAKSIRDYAKERAKEIGKDKELQIKYQSQYNAARMVINYNDEQAKELVSKGFMTNAMRKDLKTASELDFNAMTVQDNDINVISQFALLNEVANSKDDGSEDYNNKLLGLMADATKSLNEFVKENGTSKEIFQASTNTMFNMVANSDIQEVLQPVYDENSLLGQTLNRYKTNSRSGNIDIFKDYETKGFDNKVLRETASKGLMTISLMASQLNNENLTDEQKNVIKDNIKQYRNELNKNMIKAKYSKQFTPDYLDELEILSNLGKDAMFMKNGITYQFMGYSNNDILVKIVK